MAEGAEKKITMAEDKESLWSVITDYENYPKFIPGVEKCTVLEKKGNSVFVEYELHMLMKRVKYVLKHVEKPFTSLKWSMESGDFFKSNDGSWAIKEIGPNKLEVTYTVSVGVPGFIPGAKSIINGLVGSTLPKMLEDFESQAQKLAKKAAKKTPAKSDKKKS